MAKAIMVQGTMSNAGKSYLAAALCRIFQQDGYRVAPFKSQNMALNSFITEEGLEMGRAQVMQAEAAGIKPSVLMNPILLKPTNDTGSQVIVNGEVLGNLSAGSTTGAKRMMVPHIMQAYRQLDEQYDIIVLEGAGSPAEINLKQDDIVNMGMAKLAKAPVLLVGRHRPRRRLCLTGGHIDAAGRGREGDGQGPCHQQIPRRRLYFGAGTAAD